MGPAPRYLAPLTALEFHEFYVQNWPKLMGYFTRRYGRNSHVEDIVQEAFLLAWTQRAGFRGDAPFAAYLKGIARNLLRNVHRSGAFREDTPFDQNHPAPAIGTDLPKLELIEQMQKRLSAKQWNAVDSICLRNMTIAEAARQTGCKPAVLYNRLSRARNKIRRFLNPIEDS
jgi:RNA polymerase sigma-70 factor, ECF subfamily